MPRLAPWKLALSKIVAIVGVIALAGLLVAPRPPGPRAAQAIESDGPSSEHRAPSAARETKGGVRLVVAVDRDDVRATMAQTLRDDVRRILGEEKVAPTGGFVPLPVGAGVQLQIPDAAARAKVMARLRQLAAPAGFPPATVSDDGAGTIRIEITEAVVTDKLRRAADQSIDVIRRRLDTFGIAAPSIEREGDDRIRFDVPGIDDARKLKALIGTTARLTFQLVAEPGEDPLDVEMLEDVEHPGQKLPVEKQVMVEGRDLVDARPSVSAQTGAPILDFRFDIRGSRSFGRATSENVGRRFAIVLDGKVLSAPKILGPITGGAGQIYGNFTEEQVGRLAMLLRAGALPAKLVLIEERKLEPGDAGRGRLHRAIFGLD